MTTAASPLSPGTTPWLFGPGVDLLLGCGALYLLLFAVFVLAGDLWLASTPAWLAPLCVLLFSLPHYGATLVRVYEHRSDRRAYAIFTVWVTAALMAAFAVGIYSVGVGSFLLTVYLSWSPWHYTGQNYGLAVLFLRRQGVAVQGAPKRWLHASFVLSFALTLCVIHESSTWSAARSLPEDASMLHFVPVGVPGAVWLVPLLGAAWLVSSAVALGWALRQTGRGATPVALLLATQSLWFAVPAVGLHWGLFEGLGPLDAGSVGAFLVWIAVGHAVQYLWVTAFYARAASDWRGLLPWLGKTAAAGALVWTLPVLLLASRPFGAPSYETGLAFLVASVVNLHHFILDGAIWKLRNGRIARVLIASGRSDREAPATSPLLRTAVWSAAAACLLAAVFVFVNESWLLPRALESGEVRRASQVLDRLAWAGRDPASARAAVGEAFARKGELRAALAEYERSAAMRPLASSFAQVAMLNARLGDPAASRTAQDAALALEPTNARLFDWAALLSERLGDPERAALLRARAAAIPAADDSTAVVSGPARLY